MGKFLSSVEYGVTECDECTNFLSFRSQLYALKDVLELGMFEFIYAMMNRQVFQFFILELRNLFNVILNFWVRPMK